MAKMGGAVNLNNASNLRLARVHPDLVKVVRRAAAISKIDFIVTEGARSLVRQKALVKAGASQTLNSRHIPGIDGFAKAVDLAALVGGKIRWDWPLYAKLAAIMKQAAKDVGVAIEWGGDWKSFKDGPHFQLPRAQYP